jgi:hypothetical protein
MLVNSKILADIRLLHSRFKTKTDVYDIMSDKRPISARDIPEWVRWLAQDADGTWWGYEVEPHQHHQGWYENELGRCRRIRKDEANPEWQSSLTKHKAD